ncbi:retrovirus-related Pol polyprotein from transposon 17.6 [Trichonephila clavipes]|nr:retrovirus-related Pol polyprotein from transposon 17.6 [Trichonephila clavipes]
MAEPSKHTSRLFLLDRKSGQKFLIDSGSEICVIPPSPTMNKSPKSNFSLFAANNTKIPAYGMVRKRTEPGRFLPKAAEQQYLLSEFLKGSKGKKDSKPLNWSSEAITAFQRCKQALADAALLAHPSPSAPLALHVDASDYAIGGALYQVVDSELQPLAFFSRKLTSSEKSYSAYDRELLAIYSAIRHFRYMLEARDFTVFTDHKPLTYALGKKVTSVLHGRSVSWISSLSSPQILYTFQDLTILLLMFSLVFLQSPSQVKLTMTVLLRHNRLIRSFTP